MAFSPAEWRARQQLAACCRVFDLLGWNEPLHNHVSARVPGPYPHFLIKPSGVPCGEVTASALVKVDVAGQPVGRTEQRASPAAVALHAALYAGIERAHCVMSLHTIAGTAVSASEQGLAMTSLYAAQLPGRPTRVDVEGLLLNNEEATRLARAVVDTPAVLLRRHGLMVWGETLARAFHTLWLLQRACEVQVASAALGPTAPLSPEQQRRIQDDTARLNTSDEADADMFEALVRQADRLDDTWRQ